MRAPLDEGLLRQMLDEAKLGHPEMAARLGVSIPTVTRAMRRLGLKSKKGRGSPMEKNYFWNGGRTIDEDGYVLVKSPDHPNRTKAGYVREHRLVMEKILGRFLLASEVVHHKDGNKANNDPGNLQVFSENAEHLRHELTGRTPKYSQDGLRRMRENAQRVNRRRASASRQASKSDAGL